MAPRVNCFKHSTISNQFKTGTAEPWRQPRRLHRVPTLSPPGALLLKASLLKRGNSPHSPQAHSREFQHWRTQKGESPVWNPFSPNPHHVYPSTELRIKPDQKSDQIHLLTHTSIPWKASQSLVSLVILTICLAFMNHIF